MTSRRNFIRDTTFAAGGLLVAGSSFAGIVPAKKKKVIVIGAGFSGLAAARSLQQKNVDVLILEARNRISGRVFSQVIDEPGNLVVELGAEWVGNSHTRVQELCGQYDLALDNNQFNTDLIFKGKHSPSGEWKYSDNWINAYEKIRQRYPAMSLAEKKKLDKQDWWRFLMNQGCSGDDLEIRELLDSTDFGESIRQVSAYAALAEYMESSEKNEMDLKIRGGNSSLAYKMQEEIGPEKILLKHRVQRVTQHSGGVRVTCSNGAAFEADKLICTAPAFAVSRIDWLPVLPADQALALDQLQYARISKNPVLFSSRFWKREDFDLVTDELPHYFYHATKNQPGPKGALLSYTIGEKAAVVSNQPEQARADMICRTLEPHFGPIRSLIEKQAHYYWGQDEFSHGAYALYGPGQWFGIQPLLKRSFLHTHFAGEHLADWQGFMEGAINTGEEAAAKV